MTLEMGKPLKESRGEVAYAAEFFRWFSEEAVRISGRWSVAPNGATRLLTMKQPVGPCLFITPWNFPLAMGTRKIGPAVAAGCTMVVKPADPDPAVDARARRDHARRPGCRTASSTSITTSTHRRGHGAELIRDPRLRKLSFTGSTEVGRRLVEQSAEQLLRVSMELGGNAPFLVFADADLDAGGRRRDAREDAQHGRGLHGGEPVHRARVGRRRVLPAAGRADGRAHRRPGHRGRRRRRPARRPRRASARSASWSQDAVDRGRDGAHRRRPGRRARATSSRRPCSPDVAPDARLLDEEIFGPVAPVTTFATDDEALALANDTEFGLVAYVFTQGPLAARCASPRACETGMVGINQGIVSNPAAPVRRRQAVRIRPRGRRRGHRGVPGDQVRRHRAMTRTRQSPVVAATASNTVLAAASR